MGFFNFFKGKKPNNEESLESLFVKAANDNAIRPLFYRTLLKSDLILLSVKDAEPPGKNHVSDDNTILSIRTLQDGVVPVFTSQDRIFDNNIITEQVSLVKLNAKVIFEMFDKSVKFILNPYSDIRKEFVPQEIEALLKNELYKIHSIIKIKKGETILLGVPEINPVNLIEALKRYFDTRPEIKAAYLALIRIEGNNEEPHFLLGIEIYKENLNEIFGEAGEIAKPYLKKSEPLDMINVAAKSSTARLVTKSEYKIY